MDNYFQKNPLKVIVGATTYVLIADGAPGHKSPPAELRKFYGPKYAQKLLITSGGAPDTELEELEEELALEDIEDIDLFDSADNLQPQVEVEEIEELPKSVVYTSNIYIYPEDRISELKLKLSVLLKIPHFRQHVYILQGSKAIPLSYRIYLDTLQKIDIRNIEGEDVLGIPVDQTFYNMRSLLRIEAYDHFQTMGELFQKTGQTTIYVSDLDTYIAPQRAAIEQAAKTDEYRTSLLYYGFVVKYWPMLTPETWIAYLIGNLKDNYPLLEPSQNALTSLFNTESEIINEVYLGKGFPKELEQTSIALLSLAITVDKFRTFVRPSLIGGEMRVNVRNVFDLLSLDDGIVAIKARLQHEGNAFILTKINPGPYHYKVRNIRMNYYNTVAIVISEEINDYELLLIIMFFDNGKYIIRTSFPESMRVDFSRAFKIIQKRVNRLVARLNEMGRQIFDATDRLNDMTMYNSEFTELTMNFFWHQLMSESVFDKLMAMIRLYYKAGIFKDKPGNPREFYFYKGITKFDIRRLERNLDVSNYYMHLSDPRIRQRWALLFETGRLVEVAHRSSDVRFRIENIREDEFRHLHQYLLGLIRRLTENIDGKFIPTTTEIKPTKNRLRRLKEKDPNLYNFKQYGSSIVYSRICQKPNQPLVYSEAEASMLPPKIRNSLVKYWNFTTQSPMMYYCPDPKYPHLRFLTGFHPKNYCIPCCKKTPVTSEQTKKTQLYKVCMESHVYSEEEIASGVSRYIMGYGKDIEIDRLGYPPISLTQFLINNTQLGAQATDELRSPNYYIVGVPQNLPNTNNVGSLFAIAQSLSKTVEEVIEDFVEYLEKNPTIFADSREDVLQILSPEVGLPLQRDINSILIDICYSVYGVRPLVIYDSSPRSEGTTSSDQDETLNIELGCRVVYTDDIIPEQFAPEESFIILIKRNDRTMEGDFNYYPLQIVIPRDFFRNMAIMQKTFTNKDDLVIVMRSVISKLLQKPTTYNMIDLKIMEEFLGDRITERYLNLNNLCYGIMVDEVFLPVSYSVSKEGNRDPFYRRNHKLPQSSLMDLIKEYNKFIRDKSVKMGLRTPDGTIIPYYPLIKPEAYLQLRSTGKLIGFISSGLYYYANDIQKKPKENLPVKILQHDPDVLNEVILTRPAPMDTRIRKINESLYDVYLYDLLVNAFINQLDMQRNIPLRKRLKKLISAGKMNEVSKIIDDVDFKKIQSQLEMYGKKEYFSKFDSMSYRFDRALLLELSEMSKKDLVRKLEKMTEFVRSSGKIPEITNQLQLKQLVIPPRQLKKMIELLADDLRNPLKRNYFLLNIFNRSLVNYYKFRPKDDIYISL